MSDEQSMYPVKPEIAATAHINSMEEYQRLYRLSLDDPQTFWSKQAERISWFHPWSEVFDSRLRQHRLQLVPRRAAQRLLQLRRSPPADPGRPGRHHLGQGRARPVRAHHLPPAQTRGEQGGQRASAPRRAKGRSGVHLHAHDPRAGLHHAGVRPHRRRPLHRLRRLLRRGHPRPDPGRRRQAWSPPTKGCAAAACCASRTRSIAPSTAWIWSRPYWSPAAPTPTSP
jgi:hypothetical protein